MMTFLENLSMDTSRYVETRDGLSYLSWPHALALAGRPRHSLVVFNSTGTPVLPMFGGVRRQLRRLIRGYAKLYEKKLGKPWPGPNPEQLPIMREFKKS